jgi:ATP-dependent RNA helicase RhlE
VPRDRQTLFFTATLPSEVRQLADSMLRDPLEVKTTPQSTPAETVAQSVFLLAQRQKRHLLVHLLSTEGMARVIVFTRTKHGADKLARDLDKAGIRAAAIHGNKSQNQREKALAAFKSQHPPVLIATDIAARGIDVDNVSHVVNYELPHEPETYVHRIGRTGRAGMTGKAISLCDHEERPRLQAIERLLRKAIPVRSDLPDLPQVEAGGGHGDRRGGPSRQPQGRGAQRRDDVRGSAQGRGRRGGRNDGRRPAADRQDHHAPRHVRRAQGHAHDGGSQMDPGSTGTAVAPAKPAFRPRKKHRRAL